MPKASSGTSAAGPTLFPTYSAWGGSLFYLRQGAQAVFGTFSHNKHMHCHFFIQVAISG